MKISRFPYYIFLLPVFFVLHTVSAHWLSVDASDQLLLTAKYCLAAGILFILFYLLLKKINKAGLIVFALLTINFFFPEVHNALRSNTSWTFISRYLVIIPFLLLLLVLFFIKIKKNNSDFSRVTSYLNILFILLLIGEVIIISGRSYNSSKTKISVANDVSFTPCDTCEKPDIYFLVFDEYSSSLSLRQDYNYDNQFLDTFLIERGFRILTGSKSNYNITSFSVASIMNMSYLRIAKPDAVTSIDYSDAAHLVDHNRLCSFLGRMGYEIENYSIFDINNKPAPLRYYFTPTPLEILKKKTFTTTLLNETGWNFFSRETLLTVQQKKFSEALDNIKGGIDSIKRQSLQKSVKPRFIYGHLLLPHSPFMMNKTIPYSTDQLLGKSRSSIGAYLNYVYYTNTVIKDLVLSIQEHTEGKAVIIIMGDHGWRSSAGINAGKYFSNQNAIYFPDQNYKLFYDSISGVNQFRLVLNTLFKQNLAVTEDEQHYLQDRK